MLIGGSFTFGILISSPVVGDFTLKSFNSGFKELMDVCKESADKITPSAILRDTTRVISLV